MANTPPKSWRATAMYGTLTQDFADRASELLAQRSRASILYAALEVRMGVEARLQSYVQANDEVALSLKKGWEIPKLFKGLEKTLSNSSQVVELGVSLGSAPPVLFHFIPVSARLRSHAARFGGALHVTADSHGDDRWWVDLEKAVEEALQDLKVCARASLLGVPLLDPRADQIHTKFEFHRSDERLELVKGWASTRGVQHFSVTYISTEDYYASAR